MKLQIASHPSIYMEESTFQGKYPAQRILMAPFQDLTICATERNEAIALMSGSMRVRLSIMPFLDFRLVMPGKDFQDQTRWRVFELIAGDGAWIKASAAGAEFYRIPLKKR